MFVFVPSRKDKRKKKHSDNRQSAGIHFEISQRRAQDEENVSLTLS